MANIKIINKKKQQVKDLVSKIEKSEIVLITNYRGINVADDTKLRKNLREAGAEYSVIKNNIVKRAFQELEIEIDEEKLMGPTAVVTSEEDYLAPLKVIYKFMKENDFYLLKTGLIEGKEKTNEEIMVLAQLPSREELLGKIAGVLLANISKLAVALDQVKEKKENEKPAEEVKEEKTEENKEEAKKEKADDSEEEKESDDKAETKEETEEKSEETKNEEKKEDNKEDNKEENKKE